MNDWSTTGPETDWWVRQEALSHSYRRLRRADRLQRWGVMAWGLAVLLAFAMLDALRPTI